MPKMTIDEFSLMMVELFPWASESGMVCEYMGRDEARLRLPFKLGTTRPGGTISGPTMMMLADTTMYAVILAAIGRVELAVTTSFNINFLYRPSPVDLIAEGRMLKLGKRLAVMEVTIHSDGHGEPVAHATGTYSIPPGAI